MKGEKDMDFIVDKKTNIYHRPQCGCLTKVEETNQLPTSQNIFVMYTLGYTPCKICSPLIRRYEMEKKEIKSFCLEHGISMKVRDETILIDTHVSSWKIIYVQKNRKYLRLYHENTQLYFKCKQVNGEIIKQYHNQTDAHSSTILGYLEYIYEHDQFRDKEKNKYKHQNKNTRTQKYLYRRSKRRDINRSSRRVYNLLDELQAQNKIKEELEEKNNDRNFRCN